VLPLDAELEATYMSLLGPEEADRYRSSGGVGSDKSPSRAAEWLLSRVLLRTTLAKYCQPYVAPQVAEPLVHFYI